MVVSNLDDVPSIRIDHGGKCSDEVANQGISAHIVPGLGIFLIILLHKRLFA